ncbi:hypothetical protein P9223_06825 [Geobacillus stearothermophilus]|nr:MULTISPECIES: hypothetical protein [Geobacillus]MED4333310.1 hypothetical protein [Geobacillus stearothermophilus]
MYQFLLNLWIMNRITETNIQNAVNKGFITQEEANTILATPKAV